jgi:hypothetical protein
MINIYFNDILVRQYPIEYAFDYSKFAGGIFASYVRDSILWELRRKYIGKYEFVVSMEIPRIVLLQNNKEYHFNDEDFPKELKEELKNINIDIKYII